MATFCSSSAVMSVCSVFLHLSSSQQPWGSQQSSVVSQQGGDGAGSGAVHSPAAQQSSSPGQQSGPAASLQVSASWQSLPPLHCSGLSGQGTCTGLDSVAAYPSEWKARRGPTGVAPTACSTKYRSPGRGQPWLPPPLQKHNFKQTLRRIFLSSWKYIFWLGRLL